MPRPPARDTFGVLDWIMSRQVHEYLDVAGRPVGEGRAAAFKNVQTEIQICPYAGSRHHHAKPMNVSALRLMMPVWDDILTMLSWLSQRYCARHGREITTYDDLSMVVSAGVFLADFLTLRRRQPLPSGAIPVLISGLYKVCLGFQLATFLASMQEQFTGQRPDPLPDAASFYAYLETHELLIGEAEVCAGPPAMIMEAYDAMTKGRTVEAEALPSECSRLDIAWEQFDVFTNAASGVWYELVLYVLQTPPFCPKLEEPRLPPDVQQRLNLCLKRRASELLVEQRGLVVDIARGALEFYRDAAGAFPAKPTDQSLAAPGERPGKLAATVMAWLNGAAPNDMQIHAAVVADALQVQLALYDPFEAQVLSKLNQHVSCLMAALGLDRSGEALTYSALSQVCGRTLRDWGDDLCVDKPGKCGGDPCNH
jgi:hypothetical protein